MAQCFLGDGILAPVNDGICATQAVTCPYRLVRMASQPEVNLNLSFIKILSGECKNHNFLDLSTFKFSFAKLVFCTLGPFLLHTYWVHKLS